MTSYASRNARLLVTRDNGNLATTWHLGNETASTTIDGLQTLTVSDKLACAWSSFRMITTAKPRFVPRGAYDMPAQNATRRNAYTEALQKFDSEQAINLELLATPAASAQLSAAIAIAGATLMATLAPVVS
jgi:hypothetical protein